MEQYAMLREDSREMVSWWYDKNLWQRVKENVARQNRNEFLDEHANKIRKAEAERHRKWMKQCLMTRTTLAFNLDVLHLRRQKANLCVVCERVERANEKMVGRERERERERESEFAKKKKR